MIVLLAIVFFIGLKQVLRKRLFSETSINNKNIVVDSLLLEAISENNNSHFTDSSHQIDGMKSDTTFINNSENLDGFFEKLAELESSKKGNIRIAYFGDSMTDGDFIVQDLRQLLQDQFGGKGVGFVSITSESAQSRGSIKHTFSDNWKNQSYVNVKNPTKPFGVNGRASFASDTIATTWVQYKASGHKYLTELYNPTLYFGHSKNKNAFVEISYNSDTTKVVKQLHPDNKLNRIVLAERNLKSVKINFKNADSIAFYGINSFDNNGITVDNFSSRGNSGLPLSLLNTELMNEFDKDFDYDLIVLHFGTNVLNYGNLNYSWYEKAMSRVIDKLKNCFPQANFLIISTADKSTKYEMAMKTDSAVIPLNYSQQKYAQATQSGFISLYNLMGGENSMVKWVEEEPILATKDYTHFNHKGSKKVAELIYNNLIEQFKEYKKRHNKN